MKRYLCFIGILLSGMAALGNSQDENKRDTESTISVTAAGAVPDGVTDCTAAFRQALTSGRAVVVVPPGKFAVSQITVPRGITLIGGGSESLIVPLKNAVAAETSNGKETEKLRHDESAPQKLIVMIEGSTIKNLNIDAGGGNIVGIYTARSKDIVISGCGIKNTKSFGINLSHVDSILVENNNICNAQRAINIDFSNNLRVLNNSVSDCTEHGIQFWGNYNWKDESRCQNIIFSGNIVKNGGRGAIWGTGYRNIIMSNNLIDGAKDVGLDLEWCDDSVIVGNVVRNTENGGISLFFRCRRVTITGNTVINNWEWQEDPKPDSWWVRTGIWLTYPNTKTFKDDTGHEDITISGNTIFNSPGKRRAIWIGSEAKRITITSNTINKDLIYFGGVHEKNSAPLDTFNADPIYINSASKIEAKVK